MTPTSLARAVHRSRPVIAIGSAVAILVAFLAVATPNPAAGSTSGPGLPALPLSTSGAAIVDSAGEEVVLQGVNWFGFETAGHAPHGLWARDFKEMLAQIRSLGFNTLRLPFSLQALDSSTTSGIDYSAGRNAELRGLTPQEAMDVIIDEAAQHDLMVVLDNHSLADDGYMYDLWYGQGGYGEVDWIEAWKKLADRYSGRPNVIGADLKNEPHGRATWGTGGETDWRLAAERAGNAVLERAPHWLVFVEGIEGPVAGGQQLDRHWWGGNLEGVRDHPVRLRLPNRLVYSPHEYGPGVHDQPWFSDPAMASVLADRWHKGFGFIVESGIAPVLIGEFGARNVGLDSTEGRWIRQLADYVGRTGISWTYWSWNPNSGDTGGVLRDDWLTVHPDKMALLTSMINREPVEYGPPTSPPTSPTPSPPSPSPPSPSPTPTPTLTPTPSATATAAPTGDVSVRVEVDSAWGDGWCGKFVVANGRPDPIRLEVVEVELPIDTPLTSTWNGDFNRSGSTLKVRLPDWAGAGSGAEYRDTGMCAGGAPVIGASTVSWRPVGQVTDAPTSTAPSPSEPSGSVTPTPEASTPTGTPTPQPTADGSLEVEFFADSSWPDGYCRSTLVRNAGPDPVERWELEFELPETAQINQSWSGQVTRSGSTVKVNPPDWAWRVAPGQVIGSFGFCVTGSGEPHSPVVTPR